MRGPPGRDKPDGALCNPMLKAVATPTKRCSQGGNTGVSICFVRGVLQERKRLRVQPCRPLSRFSPSPARRSPSHILNLAVQLPTSPTRRAVLARQLVYHWIGFGHLWRITRWEKGKVAAEISAVEVRAAVAILAARVAVTPISPAPRAIARGAAEATIPRRNRGLGHLLAAARDADARGNLILDLQIVALCQERGIDTILTNDCGFDRFKTSQIQRLDL